MRATRAGDAQAGRGGQRSAPKDFVNIFLVTRSSTTIFLPLKKPLGKVCSELTPPKTNPSGTDGQWSGARGEDAGMRAPEPHRTRRRGRQHLAAGSPRAPGPWHRVFTRGRPHPPVGTQHRPADPAQPVGTRRRPWPGTARQNPAPPVSTGGVGPAPALAGTQLRAPGSRAAGRNPGLATRHRPRPRPAPRRRSST
jgi:hypothetical protein